jgi:hypothetical protein
LNLVGEELLKDHIFKKMSKQIPVKLDGLIQSPSFGKSPSIDITDI